MGPKSRQRTMGILEDSLVADSAFCFLERIQLQESTQQSSVFLAFKATSVVEAATLPLKIILLDAVSVLPCLTNIYSDTL